MNTLDAYKYLGAAELSVQTAFGINYIQNFMGAQTLILSSEIEEGKVIATPADNIVLYYVDDIVRLTYIRKLKLCGLKLSLQGLNLILSDRVNNTLCSCILTVNYIAESTTKSLLQCVCLHCHVIIVTINSSLCLAATIL